MNDRDASPTPGRGLTSRLSVQNWVHLILAVFVLVVCAGLTVGGLVLSRISDRTTELVDRIQPARSSSFQLQNALLEQETGVRGFALTGDPAFLRPYEAGMRDEKLRMARVRALVGDEQPFMRRSRPDRRGLPGVAQRACRAARRRRPPGRPGVRDLRPDPAEHGRIRHPAPPVHGSAGTSRRGSRPGPHRSEQRPHHP